MKIKNLLLALGIMLSSLAVSPLAVQAKDKKDDGKDKKDDTTSTFSAEDCPASSLYKTNEGKAKDSADIKTLADCNLAKTEYNAMKTATQIINVITGLVGIIAVAVIVIGGITFATSQGDAPKVAKAKNTILYGVVGLVVALLAWAIVNFVLSGVFG